jgi:predicted DNA-binding protein (UPF0251 family)
MAVGLVCLCFRVVGMRLAKMKEGGDRKSKNHSATLQNDFSQAEAAKRVGVSRRMLADAVKVGQRGAREPRAMIGTRLANMREGRPKKNSATLPSFFRAEAAKRVGVSTRLITDAVKVGQRGAREPRAMIGMRLANMTGGDRKSKNHSAPVPNDISQAEAARRVGGDRRPKHHSATLQNVRPRLSIGQPLAIGPQIGSFAYHTNIV